MENGGKSVHQACASTWSFLAPLLAVIEGGELTRKILTFHIDTVDLHDHGL